MTPTEQTPISLKTEAKTTAALRKYIQDVRMSVAPNSGLAGIEAAMMQHNPELLLEIMKTLDEEQGIFPPSRANL